MEQSAESPFLMDHPGVCAAVPGLEPIDVNRDLHRVPPTKDHSSRAVKTNCTRQNE